MNDDFANGLLAFSGISSITAFLAGYILLGAIFAGVVVLVLVDT